jgi:hypothetical protein
MYKTALNLGSWAQIEFFDEKKTRGRKSHE